MADPFVFHAICVSVAVCNSAWTVVGAGHNAEPFANVTVQPDKFPGVIGHDRTATPLAAGVPAGASVMVPAQGDDRVRGTLVKLHVPEPSPVQLPTVTAP